MAGALLDVVFREDVVLIPQVGEIISIGPDGKALTSPLRGLPSMVIREKLASTYETFFLRFENTLYELVREPDGLVFLNEASSSQVRAHIQTDMRVDMRFGLERVSASVTPQERVHAHVLRVDHPSEPRTFCLLFGSYSLKPTQASLLFLDTPVEATDSSLRASLNVYIRTECPPIDVQGGVIAAALSNSIWVGPKESGVLIHVGGLRKGHESAEAIALDEEGKTLACALLSRRGEGIRVIRVDIQPWLKGSPPLDPKQAVLAEAKLEPRLPYGVQAPDLNHDIHPYRISPQLDRLVTKVSTIGRNEFFQRFLIVDLVW